MRKIISVELVHEKVIVKKLMMNKKYESFFTACATNTTVEGIMRVPNSRTLDVD